MCHAYGPAWFGVFDVLTPRSPGHMVQRRARVAPRPTAPPDAGPPRRSGVSTTSDTFDEDATGALVSPSHDLGMPAALQIELTSPLNSASSCAEGSQTKPTNNENTRSRNVPPTLPINQRLRSRGPLMAFLRRKQAEHSRRASS